MIDAGPTIPQPAQPKAELQPPAGWPHADMWLWDKLSQASRRFIVEKAHGRGVDFVSKWAAEIVARYDARLFQRRGAA